MDITSPKKGHVLHPGRPLPGHVEERAERLKQEAVPPSWGNGHLSSRPLPTVPFLDAVFCPFHWATGCPDIWTSIILGVSEGGFLS